MKWSEFTEIDTIEEAVWVYDKKKNKMVEKNRKVIKQGDIKITKSDLKLVTRK